METRKTKQCYSWFPHAHSPQDQAYMLKLYGLKDYMVPKCTWIKPVLMSLFFLNNQQKSIIGIVSAIYQHFCQMILYCFLRQHYARLSVLPVICEHQRRENTLHREEVTPHALCVCRECLKSHCGNKASTLVYK